MSKSALNIKSIALMLILTLSFNVAHSSPSLALGSLTVSTASVTESNFGASNENSALNLILSSSPSADVTINYSTDGECKIKNGAGVFKVSGSLTISSGNSSMGTTLSAVNDEAVEGTHQCAVSFSTASSDVNFNGINKSYSATVKDNDGLPSLNIVVSEDSYIKEGNLSFRNVYSVIRGPEEPTSSITLTVWTDSQCALRKTTLDGYTSQITQRVEDYAIPIIVVANDDNTPEGEHKCRIQHSISTSDSAYAGNPVSSRYVTVVDNDGAPPTSSSAVKPKDEASITDSPIAETPSAEETKDFVGQITDPRPIRITDPDAANNLFVIMVSSSLVAGTALGYWRYGYSPKSSKLIDKG